MRGTCGILDGELFTPHTLSVKSRIESDLLFFLKQMSMKEQLHEANIPYQHRSVVDTFLHRFVGRE